MFCSKCGTQNPDNAAVCQTCGAPMAAAPQQAAPQQPVYQQAAPQQPVYQQPAYPQQPTVPGKGMGIAGMVLGIVSLALFCIWYLAIPCAIVGAVLGGMSMSKAKAVGMKSGVGVAGVVCSCISLGVTIIYTIIIAAAVAETANFLGSFDYY